MTASMEPISPASNVGPGSRSSAEAVLLEAARVAGLQLRRDDVRAALADPEHGPALGEWAGTHLGADTLLSADELALSPRRLSQRVADNGGADLDRYTALDRAGQVDRLSAMYDLAEVQAVNEAELRAAIEELTRSTSTITKQTQTLRQQQDALSRLVKKQAENDTKRRELERSRRRTAETERRQLAHEVEQLAQTIGYRIADLEQQGVDAEPALKAAVDDAFKSDDKLLSSLQKLGWELDRPDPDEAQTVESLREACMRLIKVTVETVQAKLDAIYLDTLTAAESSGNVKPATANEVKALQDEVESLYSEILPVAQMSVEQQHLEPALASITARSGQSLNRTAAAVSYASRPPASPVRRPSPIRVRPNTTGSHDRRRSSGAPDEAPLETLCSRLALLLDEDEGKKQVASLAKVVADRSRKNADVARGAQESFEATATTQLNDARLAVQLLKDSILAESPFGQIALVDPEMDGSIAILQQEVAKARKKLQDVEGEGLASRSEKLTELVQRWGS
ncbi:tRNA processing endoribonuclease Trz1 [Purpureocillium lavendulum]|uniref:tRNA processing endoribonuclease Trz1 n=1 Tax=Purpureocillium lavendulum TaxID=1247861 RepID=A0AB34G964_9HYPO|nr:tRNA processing endoribonuclease Trz1 [Purpureocillium lavendulum]